MGFLLVVLWQMLPAALAQPPARGTRKEHKGTQPGHSVSKALHMRVLHTCEQKIALHSHCSCTKGEAAVQASGCRECLGLPLREAEKELHSWFPGQPAVDLQPVATWPKTPPPARAEGREVSKAEEWQLAMTRTSRRKRLAPKPEVPLQNRFTALQMEEERPVTSGKSMKVN